MCAVKEASPYSRDKLAEQLLNLDSRDATRYALATETYYDRGFMALIKRNPTQYQNDTKVHDYLFKKASYNVAFSEPRGKDLKDLILRFEMGKKPKYQTLMRENIRKRYNHAVDNHSYEKLNLAAGDQNHLFLIEKYKLLPASELKKIKIFEDHGFLPLLEAHPIDFAKNAFVHRRLVDRWSRSSSREGGEIARLKPLIVRYKLCDDPKFKEDLTHADYFQKQIKDAFDNFRAPGTYHRDEKTIHDLELAEACKALTGEVINTFYFLTYLYAMPRVGSNNKENPVYFAALKRMQGLPKAEQKKLATLAVEKKLRNVFQGYWKLSKKDAQDHINVFPELAAVSKADCGIILATDDHSELLKLRKTLHVSSEETCKRLNE